MLIWTTIGNHWHMEHSKEDTESDSTTKLLHYRLKSTKYKQKYELFCSENFIEGLRGFDNRSLTNALNQIKKRDQREALDERLPQDWITIKGMNDLFTEDEIKEKWILSWDSLMDRIEAEQMTKNLDAALNMEESKGADSGVVLEINSSSRRSSMSIQ